MTYEIKYEPVTVENIVKPKYNIYYKGGEFDGLGEFHSTDGINGTIREGYKKINSPNWLGLEQALFYSGLRAKAKASANLDMFEFSSLIGAFSNSKNGTVSESTLYYLLNAINADWDEADIAQLNGFLKQFNFTIQL